MEDWAKSTTWVRLCYSPYYTGSPQLGQSAAPAVILVPHFGQVRKAWARRLLTLMKLYAMARNMANTRMYASRWSDCCGRLGRATLMESVIARPWGRLQLAARACFS